MLDLIDIESYYGRVQALRKVTLHVDTDAVVTILGANGAGKSTTLKTISGLIHPSAGDIIYQGASIRKIPPHETVGMGICHVPEGRDIFMGLTVRENLRMGAFTRKDRTETKRNLEKVHEVFPVLQERTGQQAGTLSGGEQQMLAIARGLMSSPKLMLLDEPSLGLAPLLVDEIFNIITQINHEGVAILLVEQNANMALAIAQYGYVMETGAIALHDKAEQLATNDYVRRSYLGGDA